MSLTEMNVSYDRPSMEQDLRYGIVFLILLIFAGTVPAGTQQERLPEGTLRPGTRVTIPAGTEREFLFQPEGLRFVSGRARITAVGDPLIAPDGREIREFVIDVDRSPGVPWIHHDKPFRLRIRAETDFTFETRESWDWDPRKESSNPAMFQTIVRSELSDVKAVYFLNVQPINSMLKLVVCGTKYHAAPPHSQLVSFCLACLPWD